MNRMLGSYTVLYMIVLFAVSCNVKQKSDIGNDVENGTTMNKMDKKNNDKKYSLSKEECIKEISLKKIFGSPTSLKYVDGSVLYTTIELLSENERFRDLVNKPEILDGNKIYTNILTLDSDKKETELFHDGDVILNMTVGDKKLSFNTWTRDPEYLSNIDDSRRYYCMNFELRYAGVIGEEIVVVLFLDTNVAYSLGKVENNWRKLSSAGHSAARIFAIVLHRNRSDSRWIGGIIERHPAVEKRGINKDDVCQLLVSHL